MHDRLSFFSQFDPLFDGYKVKRTSSFGFTASKTVSTPGKSVGGTTCETSVGRVTALWPDRTSKDKPTLRVDAIYLDGDGVEVHQSTPQDMSDISAVVAEVDTLTAA
jgi:hypothetical protein